MASHSGTFMHRCITLPWVSFTLGQDKELKQVMGKPLIFQEYEQA